MRNVALLLALAGSIVACETHGVVDSRYEGDDGSQLSLRQFRNDSLFYYSLSARMPPSACSATRELKLVAMGSGGRVKFQFERVPSNSCS